jgi:hypothetical protein
VPSQHSLRLNYLDHIEQARPKSNYPNHEGAITSAQSNPRWRVPQGKAQLMPKQQYLGFKPGARPEQVGDDCHKSTKDRKHRAS